MSPASLSPDPGAVFASDEHRRVLGHLPVWRSDDDHAKATKEAIETGTIPQGEVLPNARSAEEIVGFMVKFDLPQTQHVTAPEGEPTTEHVEEILADLESEGYVSQSSGSWRMLKAGYEALTGANGNEPPPLEGTRLEIAEKQDELLAQEERELAAQEPEPPNFPLGESGEAARSEPAPRREV